jgi:heterodisulfide reductase subunit B
MEFAYYPGCSLEYTAKPYDQSVREVFRVLGIGLREIEDWNCCGATMYMSINKLVAFSVSARNLAIAQKMGCEVCAPCSSCYTILRKTNQYLKWDPHAKSHINEALKAANLSYDAQVNVRHPLDILVNDVGIETIAAKARYRLDGLRVACYYGCQIVRPNAEFDDPDDPQTMDKLLAALGAEIVPFADKVRCCGGMLMTTYEEVAQNLNHNLLRCADENGAEVISTVCPLCQMNLEAYQPQINQRYGSAYKMPVVYFTQLIGLALGIEPGKLGMDSLIVKLAKPRLKAKKTAEVTA